MADSLCGTVPLQYYILEGEMTTGNSATQYKFHPPMEKRLYTVLQDQVFLSLMTSCRGAAGRGLCTHAGAAHTLGLLQDFAKQQKFKFCTSHCPQCGPVPPCPVGSTPPSPITNAAQSPILLLLPPPTRKQIQDEEAPRMLIAAWNLQK